MASRFLAVWVLISFLTTSPTVLADCPLLTIPPFWDREDNGALPYFTVQSQVDADLLATCDTFTGDLFISGSNASAPLMIPGPTHIINGTLKVLLSPHTDPRFTSLTMSSLVSVSGNIRIHQSLSSNVTTLSFPSLEYTSQDFRIADLPALTTLDFPRLSHAKSLSLFALPALHTLSVPALTSVSHLSLTTLPALHALSFPAPFNSSLFSFGPQVIIRNTSLSQISGLSFPSLTSIDISFNRNLRLITLPFPTLASTPYDAGIGSIVVHNNGNGDDLVLDLPKLKRVKGEGRIGYIGPAMYLHGVCTVNVPELELIDGDLNIGALSRMSHPMFNYSTALTHFSAPKLSKIGGSLNVGNSSLLEFITFPALKTIGGDIRISGTPAVDFEKRIEMPRLRRVHSVQVVGSEPYCADWDARRNMGVVSKERFWCGLRGEWTVEEMDHKLWEDRKAIDQLWKLWKDRFGIDDCYPNPRRWCAESYGIEICYPPPRRWCFNGKGLNWGGVRRVLCAMMVVVFFVVWWVRRVRRVQPRGKKNSKHA